MSPECWQKIEQLYHTALEQPAAQRADWLKAACADDAELYGEVQNLLAANESASGFLTLPALAQAAPGLAQSSPTTRLGELAGQQLSHYEMLARIGAGGMGEVYVARDQLLDRRVAIKLLPAQFTQDKERLQRFTREAKAVSTLNHPNIITIYEIGETPTVTGGIHFIATELIEGVTLRAWQPEDESQRLNETITIGIQIASALDAAHQAGIVHRDIKPDNLMVRPDGLVKVLDFGLAKLSPKYNSGENFVDVDTEQPTTPAELETTPGVILGTLRYMSPEQARARVLDARTDIFSLGIVLYEMLTAKPLFAGETSADVIAAILHKEPAPLAQVLPGAPLELERILHKALAKNRRDRYQTARDLQIDLQAFKQEAEHSERLARSGATGAPAESQPRNGTQTSTSAPWWRAGGAALVIGLLALIAWQVWVKPSARPQPRLQKLVDTNINSGQSISRLQFSPDGKLLAYSISQSGGLGSLWVRQFATQASNQLTEGSGDDRAPIWSPDGQQLAFLSKRGGTSGIWVMSFLGGSPKLLQPLEIANRTLIGWAKNGLAIYLEYDGNLWKLELATGQLIALTDFDRRTGGAAEFSVSPNEEWLAYRSLTNGKSHVMVRPLHGGVARQITAGASTELSPVWFPDNRHLAFSSDRTGRYQVYLSDRDASPPEQVFFSDDNQTNLAIAPDGQQLIASGTRQNAHVIAFNLRTGKERVLTNDFGLQLYPELSPDGTQLAYQATNANINLNEAILLKTNEAASQPVQLTAPGFQAKWSPDGKLLAFIRYESGKHELHKYDLNTRNEALLARDLLIGGQTAIMPYYRTALAYQWSPQGAPNGVALVYPSMKNGTVNLWLVREDGTADRPLTNYTNAELKLESPHWSPDGGRIAFLKSVPLVTDPRKRKLIVTICQPDRPASEVELFTTEQRLSLLGWSANGQALYLATSNSTRFSSPAQVTILKLVLAVPTLVTIGQIPAAYFYSLTLAPATHQTVAAVSREAGQDNLVLLALESGALKQLTQNTDATEYYASLAWAPDEKALYLSKQTEGFWLSLIENFR